MKALNIFSEKGLIMELISRSMIFSLLNTFDRNMKKEGWDRLKKDSRQTLGMFTAGLVNFFQEGESFLYGDKLENRACEYSDLAGQRHLEAMLRSQKSIPAEWRTFCLVGIDTIWIDSSGDRRILCLCFNGQEWVLTPRSVELPFSSKRCRFVHVVKVFTLPS